MTARHIVIHGKVQGVFYRDWTVETARELGLTGWVRNLDDGSVEARVEGDGDMISALIGRMHEGPDRAAPRRIHADEVEPEGFATFERR